MDKETGDVIKTVVLQTKAHVGGLAFDKKRKGLFVCVSGNKMGGVAFISYQELRTYQISQGPLPLTQRIWLPDLPQASYLFLKNEELIVGTFKKNGTGLLAHYFLPVSFLAKTNHEKSIDANGESCTLATMEILFVTKKIQGMTCYKNTILLSQSYGPKSSKLFVFREGITADLANEKKAWKVFKLPPYLEQITVEQDRLYCVFESGAAQYKNRTKAVISGVLVLDLPTLLQKSRKSVRS